MPVPVKLDAGYAKEILDALKNGKPIRTGSDKGWTQLDELAVAGACLFAAGSHGPAFPQPDLAPEQQAENDQAFIESLVVAARFLATVFRQIEDDERTDLVDAAERGAVVFPDGTVQPA